VSPIYLFELAARHAQWLSTRQATIAGNIANADTPGFKARDVEPFVEVLEKTQLAMAATAPRQMVSGGTPAEAAGVAEGDSWAIKESGNSVTLEAELLKAGEVNRDFSLNNAVQKSFHRMLMMSVKA
jgi:flagellar basal-body rod protein FlgB